MGWLPADIGVRTAQASSKACPMPTYRVSCLSALYRLQASQSSIYGKGFDAGTPDISWSVACTHLGRHGRYCGLSAKRISLATSLPPPCMPGTLDGRQRGVPSPCRTVLSLHDYSRPHLCCLYARLLQPEKIPACSNACHSSKRALIQGQTLHTQAEAMCTPFQAASQPA